MKNLLYCAALLLCLACFPITAHAWPATVVSVHDGDTLRVRAKNGQVKVIRLYAIDAPELGTDDWPEQPYAKEAKKALEALLPPKTPVEIREDQESASHGRIVATVILADGREVNRLLLENGAAWYSKIHCHKRFCQEWREAERQARSMQVGLWGHRVTMPPWTWKRKYSRY